MIAVSAFLPWVTANAGLFSFSKNGMEGDGKLTLGGGVAIAVVTFLAASNEKRWPVARIFVGLSAICVVVVSVVDYFDVRRLAREAAADPDWPGLVQVGLGLWLTGLAAVLVLAGALADRSAQRRETAGRSVESDKDG